MLSFYKKITEDDGEDSDKDDIEKEKTFSMQELIEEGKNFVKDKIFILKTSKGDQ